MQERLKMSATLEIQTSANTARVPEYDAIVIGAGV